MPSLLKFIHYTRLVKYTCSETENKENKKIEKIDVTHQTHNWLESQRMKGNEKLWQKLMIKLYKK